MTFETFQDFRDIVGPFLTVRKSEFDVTSLHFGKTCCYSFAATLVLKSAAVGHKNSTLCFPGSWNISSLISFSFWEGWSFSVSTDGWLWLRNYHQIANLRLSLNGEFAIEMIVFSLKWEPQSTNHQPFSNPSCRTEKYILVPFWDFGSNLCKGLLQQIWVTKVYLGVSKNRGTPKWMVYNGKPY